MSDTLGALGGMGEVQEMDPALRRYLLVQSLQGGSGNAARNPSPIGGALSGFSEGMSNGMKMDMMRKMFNANAAPQSYPPQSYPSRTYDPMGGV